MNQIGHRSFDLEQHAFDLAVLSKLDVGTAQVENGQGHSFHVLC